MSLFGIILFAAFTLLLWWALQHQVSLGTPAMTQASHDLGPGDHGSKIKPDDLTRIEGIGPKISELLRLDGINTFIALASADGSRLQKILDDAGPRYQMHEPGSWPEQAQLAADGKWGQLEKLQTDLQGGRKEENDD